MANRRGNKKRSWEEEVTRGWNQEKKAPSLVDKIKPNLVPIVAVGVSLVMLAAFVAYVSLNRRNLDLKFDDFVKKKR